MRNRGPVQPGAWCWRVGWLAGAIFLSCAITLFLSWHHDEMVLRRQAVAITKNLNTDSARIRAVNHWVYQNKGFAPNEGYFVIPAFGPTPIQVMERGGDCADKSRLVAAMLSTLGIDAGLVMIAPCLGCGFIHTVVEAQYESGRMVVDPIWDVDYPAGGGRFLGVADLAGTRLGRERIVELQNQRSISDKISHMPPDDAMFDYAVSMNWDRDILTRMAAASLKLTGYQPEALFRPRLLEDPKLLLSLLLIGVATGFVVGGVLLDLGLRSVMTQNPRRMRDAGADKLGAMDA